MCIDYNASLVAALAGHYFFHAIDDDGLGQAPERVVRNARRLRAELDLWKLSWQKIETLLERIEGARDQDRPHLNKLEALLRVARVVEHQRALQFESRPLSDPVIDRLPASWLNPAIRLVADLDREQAWSPEFRGWRIPGSDEQELAVANLAMPEGFEDQMLNGR